MQTRRQFLLAGGLLAASPMLFAAPAAAPAPEVRHTDAKWRRLLTGMQYEVLRRGATERPYSSPLNDEHRGGQFACAGCQLPLFSSKTKFDSGTGWPSFYAPLERALSNLNDATLGMVRTEVRCRRCGGHLGHVFDDGPRPTGLRYCMNGTALAFTPGAA